MRLFPPHSKRTHLNIILKTLQHNKPVGRTNLAGVLHTIAETTKRRGIIILISDLLDDEDDIFKGLAHLKFLKHDVIVFHQSLREGYRQRVAEFLDEIEKTAGNTGIDYCLLDTPEPLDRALVAYLAKRKRLM